MYIQTKVILWRCLQTHQHIQDPPLRVTWQENCCLDGLEGPVVINIWSIEQGSVAGFGDR